MHHSKKQEVRSCTFQIHLTEGTGKIKFPCFCYIEWKTSNGKDAVKSSNRVKLIQGKLAFNETLTFTTLMVLDCKTDLYAKKESVIILNLLSNSRPNEPKLVGRVTLELSSVANQTAFQQVKQYPLEFCSVDATISFKVILKDSLPTNLPVSDLERSDYSEVEALVNERPSVRQEVHSDVGGIPSINIYPSASSRVSVERSQRSEESTFQQRLLRLKAENEQFKSSKVSEVSLSSKSRKETESREQAGLSASTGMRNGVEQREIRGLTTDLSVPVLSKSTDEFNSNKIITNKEISEKEMNYMDSPFKHSQNMIKQPSISNAKQSQSNIEDKEEEATKFKIEIKNYQQENQDLMSQLSDKDDELSLLRAQKSQLADDYSKLAKKLNEKKEQLRTIQENNYPEQIEYLNKIIQEKDVEISSIAAFNQAFESKETELQLKIKELDEYIGSLENNHPISEGGSDAIEQITQEASNLKYKLEIQQKNHENAKIELNELREWYNEIQQQSQSLSLQNWELKSQLQEQKTKVSLLEENASQINVQEKTVCASSLQEQEDKILGLMQELIKKQDELVASNQLLEVCKANEAKLTLDLQMMKKALEDQQLKFVEQQLKLHQTEVKAEELAYLLDQSYTKISDDSSSLQRKVEEIEDNQKKQSDLVRRLKEKQENLLKIQRESQQLEAKLKLHQSSAERFKERVKMLECEKALDQQKLKALEKENKQLRNKGEKESQNLNKEISKLKNNLQNENSKKKQLNQLLSEVQLKSKVGESSKIKEIQSKLNKYIEKERLLKENLLLLEQQSNKISELLFQKEQNEQKYTQAIIVFTQQNAFLKSKINQLENQCVLLCQRNQGLESEIELLNAYQPCQEQQSELVEINRRLIQKNKELLGQMQEKNEQIAELSKSEGQLKGKEAEQLLSSSRKEKERQQYEQKYLEVVDENEKLYKEFENLNHKYQEDFNESNRLNEEKITALEAKVEEFYAKLTEKDLAYAQLELKSKEELDKVEQSLHEKEYQLEYYPNQIKELTFNIEELNSQIGEKNFQLHLAQIKIKELYETISALQLKKQEIPAFSLPNTPPANFPISQEQQQELTHYKSKSEFYQAEIERLHEKEFIQQKDLITLNEELTKLKENCEEEAKHIGYLEGELKNFREREGQYIQQIDQLEEKQDLAKSKYTRLEKDKTDLNDELQKLYSEIEVLKQNIPEKSEESTPISKFRASPSPQKPAVDITDVVGQIAAILSRRKQEEQLQNALRLVIDNNTRQEQQFQRWSRERGMIQQKAKLASKQLQKIKSNIMKTANRSIAQKSQLTNLLKPAEAIVNDLINLSENLIELDPYEQQEQEFEGEGRN